MGDGDSRIIRCRECGAKNRIPADKRIQSAKCGQCGAPLGLPDPGSEGLAAYLFRCTECGTRNRVPSERIHAGPKCGQCGSILDAAELFAAQPIMVSDGNFDRKILKSPLPALLFAWAPWCPTCRTSMPTIDALARDTKGRIRVGKLNVDTSPALASRFNILSVPQILVFDGGQLKETMPGALQKHEIMMKMDRYT